MNLESPDSHRFHSCLDYSNLNVDACAGKTRCLQSKSESWRPLADLEWFHGGADVSGHSGRCEYYTRGQVQGPAYAQWDLVFVDCVVYASSESVRQWIDVNVDANNLLAVSPATHARTSMNSEHGSGQRGHMSVTHGTLCMNCNGQAKSRGDLPCHLQQ